MKGSVYFAECSGRIKIGYSTLVNARVRAISTSAPAPVKLLGAVPGSMGFERALHKALTPHRRTGEWFDDCDEVRSLLAHVMNLGYGAIGYADAVRPDEQSLPRTIRLTLAIVQKARDLSPVGSIREMLAKSAGCSVGTVDLWIAGKRALSLGHLLNLFDSTDGFEFFDVFLAYVPPGTRQAWVEEKVRQYEEHLEAAVPHEARS